MSTEMDGATGATPVDVDEEPSAGRERVLDVVGLVVRLFLGVVLVFAGIVKVGRPLTAERAVQAYELFPSRSPSGSAWACPSSRSPWACCSCWACSPERPRSPPPC